jgi:transglutaminase-like putative cysteine protease
MHDFLQNDAVVDWQHPTVLAQANAIATQAQTPLKLIQMTFEWVRDHILHSYDYGLLNLVTCRAAKVIEHRTGYCYAKSHLLAALLRANGIQTGFCYQRLSLDNLGAPYCLHGLNAVYLPVVGWFRIDARGNRGDINTQFVPPREVLAYAPQLPGEVDFPAVLTTPLPCVISTLRTHATGEELQKHLPDLLPEEAIALGLFTLPQPPSAPTSEQATLTALTTNLPA